MTGSPKTLLIGWDGADWQILRPLIERGLLPALGHIVKNGVTADLVSLPPYLSPMLWNSIATGKRPWRHGVHGFTEIGPDGMARPVTSRSRQVPALWNILTAEKKSSLVVGWYASHPAEAIDGVCVAETFFHPPADDPKNVPTNSVAPAALGAELADLRLTVDTLDPGLVRLLCPKLTPEIAARDPKARRLAERLAEMYSIHNTAASLLETETWDFAAVYFHFVDWVMHDFEDYLPPAAPRVSRAEIERYGEVVEGACRLQDLLLAEMLRLAGPDTRVFLVSDHGYLTGKNRPVTPNVPAGIAAHHRPVGIFAACGPGLRKGAHIGTASLLDVTPTILHSLNLPVGEDMDGRPIMEIFEKPRAPKTIPSWDQLAELPARQSAAVSIEEGFLTERFAELGYVDPAALKDPAAAENQRILNGWQVGVDMFDAGLLLEALPRFEEASWANPEMGHFAYWLARCQAALGLVELADESAEVLRDFGANPQSNFYLGLLALECQRPRETQKCFDTVARAGKNFPRLSTYRAMALLLEGKWKEPFELLIREAQDNPSAEVWLGIARCYLQKGQFADAESAARHALATNPRLAMAHLCLARALARQKKKDEAWQSFLEANRLAPGWPVVRQFVARLLPERMEDFPAPPPRQKVPEKKSLAGESRRRHAEFNARVAERRAKVKPVEQVPLPPAPGSSGKTFVIVSGLPRTGTSLMMQMLQAGGLEPMTDGQRAANEHNPRGFFEWEAVKQLPKNPRLIEQAAGKAVKIISALTPYLPHEHSYKMIITTRDAGEIARSQQKMLGRAPGEKDAEAASQLARHQQGWLKALRGAKNFSVLELAYADIVESPAAAAARVAEFLGREFLPHPERMAAAVDPQLYRNRSENRNQI